jgi:hypothetical protein
LRSSAVRSERLITLGVLALVGAVTFAGGLEQNAGYLGAIGLTVIVLLMTAAPMTLWLWARGRNARLWAGPEGIRGGQHRRVIPWSAVERVSWGTPKSGTDVSGQVVRVVPRPDARRTRPWKIATFRTLTRDDASVDAATRFLEVCRHFGVQVSVPIAASTSRTSMAGPV